MKGQINFNLSQRLTLKRRKPLFKITPNKDTIYNKEQILINHKTSLESTLYLIKIFQLDFLSKQIKNDTIKMLKSLRNNLSSMLEEKNKTYKYIKNKNDILKKKYKNVLFSPTNIDKNKYDINIEDEKIYYMIFEKKQLNLLNFQIENEIKKTESLIEQKDQINSYIRSIPFFFEANREIFCNNNYDTFIKITNLLNDKIRGVRNHFIDKVKEKMKVELEINGISLQINYIKDNIEDYKFTGCKKYIETEDIIQEDSKEYSKTIMTNQSKVNTISSNNNKIIIKKRNSINRRNSNHKFTNKKKERIIKNNIQKKNILYANKINSNILNDVNNKIVNNYLNMNINVNINVNNNNYIQESFNSSLDSVNTDVDKEKNEQYEMDLNENNKIIITPIITNENTDTKNNNIKSESNNNDSFTFDISDN